MTTIFVLATEDGEAGPLNGPFTLSVDPSSGDASELLADLIALVRTVAAGVSSYSKASMANSSNLTS